MVTDHFGREIFASPYQLFLGAGDIWALKQVHEEIIPLIEGGKAKAYEQYQAQFPYYHHCFALSTFEPEEYAVLASLVEQQRDASFLQISEKLSGYTLRDDQLIDGSEHPYKSVMYSPVELGVIRRILEVCGRGDLSEKLCTENILYDERNIRQIALVKAHLREVEAAISEDPCVDGFTESDRTIKAVEKLRQLFAPTQGELIQTGFHFPVAIMEESCKIYIAQFNPWSCDKVSFFSREVIGSVEEASTVVDGQCYKHGQKKLNVEQGPDRYDGLFCRHPKGIPSDLAPLNDKLGRTMFVDPYDGASCFIGSRPRSLYWYDKNGPVERGDLCSVCLSVDVKKFAKQKTISLRSLCSQDTNPRPSKRRKTTASCTDELSIDGHTMKL